MFLMPLPLTGILILLGLFFLYRNKLAKAKVILSLSVVWLFAFSYPPFVEMLLHKIESKHPTLHQAPKDIKYIYVLGGGHSTDPNQPITSQVSESSVVRLNEGIRLYHQLHENATLIVSGYAGLYDPTPHAVMQEKLACDLGVKKEHIIMNLEPQDTQEEAKAAKAFLGNKSFILVTSASHMHRALGFFHKEGLTPIPAPTNHRASIQNPTYLVFFSSSAMENARIVFHETLGMLWQKIKG